MGPPVLSPVQSDPKKKSMFIKSSCQRPSWNCVNRWAPARANRPCYPEAETKYHSREASWARGRMGGESGGTVGRCTTFPLFFQPSYIRLSAHMLPLKSGCPGVRETAGSRGNKINTMWPGRTSDTCEGQSSGVQRQVWSRHSPRGKMKRR